MNNIVKIAAAVAGATALIIIMLWVGEKGIEGQEQLECNQWQSQAHEYNGFYLTQWQSEQCNHYGIEVDAPVR